ncbi:hypothetical protein E2C01_034219 [Portunus trituberculatus]|uniref:Uncharacterized protein n=1 Tax=Portunus trituberculatus TaxID=210409 RepID=A0A5B7F7Y6_PORTR|nr:hypothetical protein [Portunus trituberculatus]
MHENAAPTDLKWGGGGSLGGGKKGRVSVQLLQVLPLPHICRLPLLPLPAGVSALLIHRRVQQSSAASGWRGGGEGGARAGRRGQGETEE